MKKIVSRLLAMVLVVVMGVGLVSCSSAPTGLTGNYRDDTIALINTLRTAIELPDDSAEKQSAQAQARQMINDFSSLYRRDGAYTKLSSYTTMRTALNSLAGHYSSYPNRPVPEKLKERLELEFNRVESALKRGA
ncbi:MAG: photosystem II protein Psb27 [Synechococcales cyanobacterium T60_A2020_003]|nr:photosystem II protein Psb27 [Synechococcales cyanobacterium T60_A2020_003]